MAKIIVGYFATESWSALDPAGLAQALVGHVFGVALGDIRSARRGAPHIARARQVAMYMSHVVFGMPLGAVADAFGRDRSTVLYAVRQVENLREDAAFDRMLVGIEAMLRRAVRRAA